MESWLFMWNKSVSFYVSLGMLKQAAVNPHFMWKLKVGDARESTSAIIVLKKLIVISPPRCYTRNWQDHFFGKSYNHQEMDDLEKVTFDQARRCDSATERRIKKRVLDVRPVEDRFTRKIGSLCA